MQALIKRWIISGLLLITQVANATPESRFNMPRGVTPISNAIYDLHMAIFWICVAIGVIVFSVMIYSLINHRKSLGVKPATFHESVKVEILWAIVPFFILVVMAIPATRVLIHMEDTKQADVTIKVTGYQWKWQYEYLDEGISFYSSLATPIEEIHNKAKKNEHYLLDVDHEMVVPVGKKVRLLVTANDVIHSWWVPQLGIKRDAIPGFIHESWMRISKAGVYRGQCAELCGINHGYMPIVVRAVSEKDYEAWVKKERDDITAAEALATKTFSAKELMEKGKSVYENVCAVCHQINGLGILPVYPAIKGSSVSVGKPHSRHIDIILHGRNAMPAFGAQLNDFEIAAVVTYERNAFDNNTGDVIQPSEVKARRNVKPNVNQKTAKKKPINHHHHHHAS